MTARDKVAEALVARRKGPRGGVDKLRDLPAVIQTEYQADGDAVLDAIRGMSHDELRQLRPDIAILFDATQDTATQRGDYIINLIVGRLRAAERLHTEIRGRCGEDGFDWPCRTTRAVRGQA